MGARRKPLPRLRAGEVAAERRVRAIGSARCKALLRAGPITLTSALRASTSPTSRERFKTMAFSLNTRTGRGRYRPLAEINVTPLVDVMLVLLIIFMVTAPLMTSGVSVDLPKTNAQPINSDSQPLTVSINAQGDIFLQDQRSTCRDLVAKLQAIAAEQPGPPHLRARRQGPGLRPHHAGDGHHHPGRLHQGRAAGGANGIAAAIRRQRHRGRGRRRRPPRPAPPRRNPAEGCRTVLQRVMHGEDRLGRGRVGMPPALRRGAIISAILHVVVIAALLIGIPVARPPEVAAGDRGGDGVPRSRAVVHAGTHAGTGAGTCQRPARATGAAGDPAAEAAADRGAAAAAAATPGTAASATGSAARRRRPRRRPRHRRPRRRWHRRRRRPRRHHPHRRSRRHPRRQAAAAAAPAGAAAPRAGERHLAAQRDEEPGAEQPRAGKHAGEAAPARGAEAAAEGAVQPAGWRRA